MVAHAYQSEALTLYCELEDKRSVAGVLEAFAELSVRQQQMERAARLFGAARSVREEIGSPMSPMEHEDYERFLEGLRTALGDEAFTADWEAGQTLTWQEAVAFALGVQDGPQP